MIVDVEVWHWTQHGMRMSLPLAGTGYITVRDVERLLEEAHERGRRQGMLAEEWAKVLL